MSPLLSLGLTIRQGFIVLVCVTLLLQVIPIAETHSIHCIQAQAHRGEQSTKCLLSGHLFALKHQIRAVFCLSMFINGDNSALR